MGASWFQDLLARALKILLWSPWNDSFYSLNQVQLFIERLCAASPATIKKRKPRREHRSVITMLFCALNMGTNVVIIQ